MKQVGLFNDASQIPLLEQTIKECYAKIVEIQEDCPHPPSTLKKVAKADTGNWCASDDMYWYECKCGLCGKFWMEDQ